MGVERIHHVAIIVTDIDRSVDFYQNALEAEEIQRNYRKERDSWKVDLSLKDGSQIELFTFPHSPRRLSNPEAMGLRHLALAVTDLEKEVKRLKLLGIETEQIRIDEITGLRTTFFFDPDQLPLEFYEIERKK